MFPYILSFDLLLILFRIPFSSREADGIPKMFNLPPSVCEDRRDYGTAQQRSSSGGIGLFPGSTGRSTKSFHRLLGYNRLD